MVMKKTWEIKITEELKSTFSLTGGVKITEEFKSPGLTGDLNSPAILSGKLKFTSQLNNRLQNFIDLVY